MDADRFSASVDPFSASPSGPALPSLRISNSEPWPQQSTHKFNGRPKESRKLLLHVLNQLHSRPMPPTVFEALTESDNIALTTTKSRPTASGAEDDLEEEAERGFSTEGTFELMSTLRDVLTLSVSQGWQIFEDSASSSFVEPSSQKSASPFRRSRARASLLPGRPSRSRSPSPAHGEDRAAEILTQCISILSSVVLEDCRFKIASHRPSRPPNALQAVTLEIARFLLHIHQRTPSIVSQIGFAIIPAFSTFSPEMFPRLLQFFEECILRGNLEELGKLQGSKTHLSQTHTADPDDPFVVSINVEQPEDDYADHSETAATWSPWSSELSTGMNRTSNNAPYQHLSLYHLASMLPPLLASILENIDLLTARAEVRHRMRRLLECLLDLKHDAYLDFLQVIAYHSTTARYAAASFLVSFWPRAIGHVIISSPFPAPGYQNLLAPSAGPDHPYNHQFVPWSFTETGTLSIKCRVCISLISGFGLSCPFCRCAVHADCYDHPDGSRLVQYTMENDEQVKKMAIYRFSALMPSRKGFHPFQHQNHRHSFRRVNLFTLSLCFGCRKPLWGCIMQAMQCGNCGHFFHSNCASATNLQSCGSVTVNSSHTTIQWSELRRSCVEHYPDLLGMTEPNISQLSYEELSVLQPVLWLQVQLMTQGVASGSIVIMQKGKSAAHAKGHKVDPFELHHVLAWCEKRLASSTLPLSAPMEDYLQEAGITQSNHSMMFDWSNLLFIATSLKVPYVAHIMPSSSSDLLLVHQPENEQEDDTGYPFEVVSLAHIRDILGHEYNVHSDAVVRYFLMHLYHLGFFERADMQPFTLDHLDRNSRCLFPVPLGLDLSADVEVLFSSVETCLAELDLSINEVGFLLLTRRLWPSGMATKYALERLTRTVISWVLAEDENLAAILRDYLAKQQSLPGVRSGNDALPWPSIQSSRPTAASSRGNGGDYVAARRALHGQYVVPWLQALHGQDPAQYSFMIYEICVEFARNISVEDLNLGLEKPPQEQASEHCDKVLRNLLRLSQNLVVFTVWDDLFVRWLDSVTESRVSMHTMPSLSRLFPREMDAAQRYSTADRITAQVDEAAAPDPWRILAHTASQSNEGLIRSLHWICIFARAGVDVPIPTFQHLASLSAEFQTSLSGSLLLMKALLASTWLKSMGRQDLQTVVADLHSRLSQEILKSLTNRSSLDEDVIAFIRISLGICLLFYGCDRSKIAEFGLVITEDIKDLPSRRRFNVRGEAISDPIIIDAALMQALDVYLAANVDEVSSLVLKFVNMFCTQSAFLEPHEVDNFILRNGAMLCKWAWHFYRVQRPEIEKTRTSMLLRVLVVDPQPLRSLLELSLRPDVDWELRLATVTRLFRVISDVNSPAFMIEDRQWRSSVTDIFFYYFSTIWRDAKEEVRLAVDTFSSTLLPVHFQNISLCWSEALAKSPVADRMTLVSFLIQLLPHFPTWKVVSWEVIIDTLTEEASRLEDPASAKDQLASVTSLNVPLVLLSLGMISNGIPIDFFNLSKLKFHLVSVLGFDEIKLRPSVNGQTHFVDFGSTSSIPEAALPCVNELLLVLDARYPLDLSLFGLNTNMGQDGSSSPLLVGSVYVDVALGLFCTLDDLSDLPALTLKALLEALAITIYKHDFEKSLLRPLQKTLRRAVLRALDLLLEDINYECQQQAMSVVQAYVKRWQHSIGSFSHVAVEQVAKLIASQSHTNQDALVAQAKAFMESTLVGFCSSGVFLGLLKRQLDSEFFVVLKQILDANAKNAFQPSEALRMALLRDALPRIVEVDQGAFQTVLNHLKSYIEVVCHQGYSPEMMMFVGQHLTLFARRASEWPPEAADDPSALLVIPSLLIQHNKAQSREMLGYTETVLRVALNRLNVDAKSLSQLIHVTSTLYRKVPSSEPGVPQNIILQVVFEILGDALRLKARVLPTTLKAMIESIVESDGPAPPALTHPTQFAALADAGFYFLQNQTWSDVVSENDFSAALAVAKMQLKAILRDPSIMSRIVDHTAERTVRHNLTLRAWNMLALAALLEASDSYVSIVFNQFTVFANVHGGLLRGYVQSGGTMLDTTEVNYGYISMKLWLLLAQRKCERDQTGNATFVMVWHELWTPFESLVIMLEAQFLNGQNLAVAGLVWSTVADLFVFLRSLRVMPLDGASQLDMLHRLRAMGRSEAHVGKLTRAIRSLTGPPSDVPFSGMVNQAAKDIVAAEKLRVLEKDRRVQGR
ncbi:hypothetical protein C8J56DRAFT_1167735 [Mycena floridula]|nr:hypothetical protein C8J56DRAFT_1167735 [Mycena floridula]